MSDRDFEPTIVAFLCNWCSYRAADLAATSRTGLPPGLRTVRLMCSGRVDPSFVLEALAGGADGVLIAGCHPGECHYIEQNLKTLRRVEMLRHTLRGLGVEDARLRLVWTSAAEAHRLAEEIRRMADELRGLGPPSRPTGPLDEVPA